MRYNSGEIILIFERTFVLLQVIAKRQRALERSLFNKIRKNIVCKTNARFVLPILPEQRCVRNRRSASWLFLSDVMIWFF